MSDIPTLSEKQSDVIPLLFSQYQKEIKEDWVKPTLLAVDLNQKLEASIDPATKASGHRDLSLLYLAFCDQRIKNHDRSEAIMFVKSAEQQLDKAKKILPRTGVFVKCDVLANLGGLLFLFNSVDEFNSLDQFAQPFWAV